VKLLQRSCLGLCLTALADAKLKLAKKVLQLGVILALYRVAVLPRDRMKMRILLIEDDKVIGSAVREQLDADGHSVDWAQRLDGANDALAGAKYDLILLDLMLPDGRGIAFLKLLRAGGSQVPVMILTALDQISDRIDGLNAGADDYLVKPFDLMELSARIGAVARRYSGNPNPVIIFQDLSIDLAARSIKRGAKSVSLTAREWVLLEAFLTKPKQLFSKAQLEERLYSFDAEVESNTIEVHVSHLRKKLGTLVILTERGMGYRLGQS
jgi:two-component system, OmpR family, response regulator